MQVGQVEEEAYAGRGPQHLQGAQVGEVLLERSAAPRYRLRREVAPKLLP